MNIETDKRRNSTMLLFPTIFYDSYHNEGKKIVNIGIAFLKRAVGLSIEITPKKGAENE